LIKNGGEKKLGVKGEKRLPGMCQLTKKTGRKIKQKVKGGDTQASANSKNKSGFSRGSVPVGLGGKKGVLRRELVWKNSGASAKVGIDTDTKTGGRERKRF